VAPQRQREYLGVVVVVRDAGGGERARGEGSVAGLPVAGHGLHETAEDCARGAVGERSVPAHAVAVSEKARAEHVIGPPASDRLEDPLEVSRVVLPVPIQVDGGGVTLVARDL